MARGLILILLAIIPLNSAFSDAEICTYGLDKDHDARRWIVKGAQYSPLYCSQSMLDDVALPVKIPPKRDWRHESYVYIDTRPKTPEPMRPTLLDSVVVLVMRAFKRDLLEDGYTLIKGPDARQIELFINPSPQLDAALKEATCQKDALRALVICATVAETRPTEKVEAFYKPKPLPVVPKKKAKAKPVLPKVKNQLPVNSADTTPAPTSKPVGKVRAD